MTDKAEFEVWQEDIQVASACGPRERAFAEAQHYALMFGQDGPVEVFEVKRTLVPVAPVDRSGEAIETRSGSTEGESAATERSDDGRPTSFDDLLYDVRVATAGVRLTQREREQIKRLADWAEERAATPSISGITYLTPSNEGRRR